MMYRTGVDVPRDVIDMTYIVEERLQHESGDDGVALGGGLDCLLTKTGEDIHPEALETVGGQERVASTAHDGSVSMQINPLSQNMGRLTQACQ